MSATPDDPRDAHLQAALRHAPDRDAQPPPALSAQILAQAHRAAASGRRASAGPGWAERWFGWMSRPVAAGAFGTVLMASFVGLMWRDGTPPQALPGAEAPVAVAPPPVAAPATAPEAESPTPIQPSAAPPGQRQRPVVADSAAPAAKARASRQVAAESRSAAVAPEPPAGAAPVLPAAPPVAAAALAPPPPIAVRNSAESAAAGPAARDAAAPAAARLSSAAVVDPLSPVIAALASPADQAWHDRLTALLDQTRGRWRPTAALPADRGEAVVDANGRVLGRLQVEADHLVWQAPDGRSWHAPLTR